MDCEVRKVTDDGLYMNESLQEERNDLKMLQLQWVPQCQTP